jgi:multiple sugar transport system substrate-binding protein
MCRFRASMQVILVLLLALSVAGCGSVLSTPAPAPEPITLRFAFPLEEKGEAYKRLADEFHDAHPDITVEVQNAQGIDFIAGQGTNIDVFEADQFHLVSLVERGEVLNLDPILQEDPNGLIDDFYPRILNAFTWQGQIWAVPADIDLWVLYYNRELFEQAGVPYPQPEWTWNDFLDTAALLTVDRGDYRQYGFGANAQEAPELIAFIYQHGGAVVDSVIDPQAPTFDSPTAIEAVGWYTDLALKHGVMTPPEVTGRYRRGGAFEAAVRQHVAMWIGPMSIRGGMVWNFDWPFDWGVVPLPQDEEQATLFMLSGYFISTHCEHPREAWLWIETVTGSPRVAWNLPPRRSVAELSTYRQRVGDEVANAALASAEFGIAPPPTPWLMDTLTWLNEALTSILSGEQTVAAAMQQVQQKAETTLAAQEAPQ